MPKRTPADRVTEQRIYVTKEDGTLDFFFTGDGDHFDADMAANEYRSDTQLESRRFVVVTLTETAREPYDFNDVDPENFDDDPEGEA